MLNGEKTGNVACSSEQRLAIHDPVDGEAFMVFLGLCSIPLIYIEVGYVGHALQLLMRSFSCCSMWDLKPPAGVLTVDAVAWALCQQQGFPPHAVRNRYRATGHGVRGPASSHWGGAVEGNDIPSCGRNRKCVTAKETGWPTSNR